MSLTVKESNTVISSSSNTVITISLSPAPSGPPNPLTLTGEAVFPVPNDITLVPDEDCKYVALKALLLEYPPSK